MAIHNGIVPRALLGAALLSLTLTLVPASAAARAGHVTLVANDGAASVDVTFARAVKIAPMRMDAAGANGWAWSGCGRVRGFYFQPLTGDPMRGVGAVDLAGLRYGDATDLPLLPGQGLRRYPLPLGSAMLDVGDRQQNDVAATVTLPRGRYRLYVLGEGHCWVRVPTEGSNAAITRTATRRAAMQHGVQSLGGAAVPAGQALAAAFDVMATRRTFAVALLHEVTYNPSLGAGGTTTAYGTCVEKDATPGCAEVVGTALPGRTPASRYREYFFSSSGTPMFFHPPVSDPPLPPAAVPAVSGATDVATWYAPGWLTPGVNTAKVTAVAAPATTLQGAMFALDLG